MNNEKLNEQLLVHTLENELRLTDNRKLAHNDGQHTILRPMPKLGTLDGKVIEHINKVALLNDEGREALTNAPNNTTFYGTLKISEDVLTGAENVGLRLTPDSYIDGEVGRHSDGFLDVPNISASGTIGRDAGTVIAPYASTKKSIGENNLGIGENNVGDVVAPGATAEIIGCKNGGDVRADGATAEIIGYFNRGDVRADGATAKTIGYKNGGDVRADGATIERHIGYKNGGDVRADGATAKYIGD